jgi:hypothetical protein
LQNDTRGVQAFYPAATAVMPVGGQHQHDERSTSSLEATWTEEIRAGQGGRSPGLVVLVMARPGNPAAGQVIRSRLVRQRARDFCLRNAAAVCCHPVANVVDTQRLRGEMVRCIDALVKKQSRIQCRISSSTVTISTTASTPGTAQHFRSGRRYRCSAVLFWSSLGLICL